MVSEGNNVESNHSNAVEPEETKPENICKDETLKDSQADSGNHSEPDVLKESDEVTEVPKRPESSCEEHEPELAATMDEIADVVPEQVCGVYWCSNYTLTFLISGKTS